MDSFLAGVKPSPSVPDVMHHCLQALSNRVESSQAHEIHRSGSQGCHHSGGVAAVSVVVLLELGVTNPVTALDAPTLSCQSQQDLWGRARAGEERGSDLERLAIACARSGHCDLAPGNGSTVNESPHPARLGRELHHEMNPPHS